tara:strand:+ start:257 stop:997 length:741 start_codon:yes stop_codon:yes gene_type:complete
MRELCNGESLNFANDTQELKNTYEFFYKNIYDYADALSKIDNDRKIGGILRSNTGIFVEYAAHSLALMAWKDLGGDMDKIRISKEKILVPVKEEYIESQSEDIKSFLYSKRNQGYQCSVDKHVFIENELVLAIECKAYAENAMLKRIITDMGFIQSAYPASKCYLFMLESQLGGDYSELKDNTLGSFSTHAIISNIGVRDFKILTHLQGNRLVKQPIFDRKFYKPISKRMLDRTLKLFKNDLIKYK